MAGGEFADDIKHTRDARSEIDLRSQTEHVDDRAVDIAVSLRQVDPPGGRIVGCTDDGPVQILDGSPAGVASPEGLTKGVFRLPTALS